MTVVRVDVAVLLARARGYVGGGRVEAVVARWARGCVGGDRVEAAVVAGAHWLPGHSEAVVLRGVVVGAVGVMLGAVVGAVVLGTVVVGAGVTVLVFPMIGRGS